MRKLRFLAPWARARRDDDPRPPKPAIYHCMSRVVDRRLVFGPTERDAFLRLLRVYEAFCGLRVLTHCLMGNHFHLLVEVPPPPAGGLSDEDLFSRLALLWSAAELEPLRERLAACRTRGDHAGAEALKAPFLRRMWDLSAFMKALKQSFTQRFNRLHHRRGTLWEERFKSVLVEDGHTARVVAAYIDLNPVRAGLASDPADWRWSGWGQAVRGDRSALAGLVRLWGFVGPGGENPHPDQGTDGLIAQPADGEMVPTKETGQAKQRSALVAYRAFLAMVADPAGRAGTAGGHAAGNGSARGTVPLPALLGRRVRAFSAGLAVGGKQFLDEVFRASRAWFGPRRVSGPRRIPKCPEPLFALRELREEDGRER